MLITGRTEKNLPLYLFFKINTLLNEFGGLRDCLALKRVVLTEDLAPIPSTHRVAHNHM